MNKYILLFMSGSALALSILAYKESQDNKRRIENLAGILNPDLSKKDDDIDDLDEYITEEDKVISENADVDDSAEETTESSKSSTGGLDYIESETP